MVDTAARTPQVTEPTAPDAARPAPATVLPVMIGRACACDAGEIFTLQRAAYVSEALLYGDVRIPPLTQTLAELDAELASPSTVALRALLGPRMVGTVRARAEAGAWHIGRLAVAPDLHGRGIGTRLLAAIEAAAPPDVERFALFTGSRSERNLRLYRRLGYLETRRERPDTTLELVHLERPARRVR